MLDILAIVRMDMFFTIILSVRTEHIQYTGIYAHVSSILSLLQIKRPGFVYKTEHPQHSACLYTVRYLFRLVVYMCPIICNIDCLSPGQLVSWTWFRTKQIPLSTVSSSVSLLGSMTLLPLFGPSAMVNSHLLR